ncbi:MAG TPA: hypothetical protein PKE45_05650 [Caldilineaceae bacterium]|mgnify:CR=1 FL=1|nr:hypothetical protein [Caldilineaceae bacterium]
MLDTLEHRSEPLLSRPAFARRMLRYAVAALGMIAFSLLVGIVGYSTLAGFGWADAFLNAAMILGGMGPVKELTNDSAKIFAGLYALYCGVVLLASVSVLLTPIVHRILHRFHLELERGADGED